MEKTDKERNIVGLVPVVAALTGNFFITVIKFAGFFMSGSSVFFSEAVHSLADTSNQALLVIGLKRAIKKPDAKFVYGYGKERFFWALISACGIFFLGAGITIYRGISAFIYKKEILISPILFAILGVSLIIELATFLLACRELKKHNKGRKFRESLKNGDPATLAVFYEDAVAVSSVILAFLSISLTRLTQSFFWDALGSVIIGFCLAVMAVVLVNKNREFLIEKTIPEDVKEKIIEILEADPLIEKVLDFKSSVLDVGVYRVKCEIELNGHMLLKGIGKNNFLKNEYELVKNDYQEFLKFCVDYGDRTTRLIGEKINKIEEKIQKEIPGIKHIDIEIN